MKAKLRYYVIMNVHSLVQPPTKLPTHARSHRFRGSFCVDLTYDPRHRTHRAGPDSRATTSSCAIRSGPPVERVQKAKITNLIFVCSYVQPSPVVPEPILARNRIAIVQLTRRFESPAPPG